MLFHYKTGDVTFGEEEETYFETKIQHLKKYFGHFNNDKDTVDVRITLEKDKHHTGERFHAKILLTCPHSGKFAAETDAENIKKCADELYEKLKPQLEKFHDKVS